MKKIFLINFLIFLTVSCDMVLKEENLNKSEEISEQEYLIGGKTDEKGCLKSAGFTWSILKNKCIRIFEIGYRLNPVEVDSDEAIMSSFVLFDESKDKVELFLPNEDASIILNKKSNDSFENGIYFFNSKDFYLTINKVKKYEAANEQLKDINQFVEQLEDSL